MLKAAHLLDSRPGNQIQVFLILRYTSIFPVVYAAWKKKKRSLKSFPLLFDKGLEIY